MVKKEYQAVVLMSEEVEKTQLFANDVGSVDVAANHVGKRVDNNKVVVVIAYVFVNLIQNVFVVKQKVNVFALLVFQLPCFVLFLNKEGNSFAVVFGRDIEDLSAFGIGFPRKEVFSRNDRCRELSEQTAFAAVAAANQSRKSAGGTQRFDKSDTGLSL